MSKSTTPQPTIDRAWHHIDAKDQILGKVATEAATKLRGKHKVAFRRHLDIGDMVVITNAALIKLSGAKETDKQYIHHTGYPGGLRTTTVAEVRATNPERILMSAINGMLPKTRQRDVWMKRLRIYPNAEHPHTANIKEKE